MSESILIDADGLSVTLPVGTTVDLKLPFENEGDSPGAFRGKVEGSGAPYATIERPQIGVSGHGRGTLVVSFAATAPGSFDLALEVSDVDGYVVEPPGRRTVTMIVEGVAVAAPEPEPILASVEPVEAPVRETVLPPVDKPVEDKPKPAPKPKKAVEKPKPAPMEAAPVAHVEPTPLAAPTPLEPEPEPAPAETTPIAAPEPEPVVEPPVVHTEPVVETPAVIVEPPAPIAEPPKPVIEEPKPKIEVSKPEPPKPRIVVEMPKPEPVPEPPKPEPTVVSFKRETKPEPVEEPVPTAAKPKVEAKPRVVVEMGDVPKPPKDRTSAPVRREPAYDIKKYGRVLRGPKTGDVLELAPGANALVLLEFENKGVDENTYVLMVKDDLRPTDDFAYARTLMEQINIRAGGTDELAFEIVVPENAPPQTLRLRISHGRRDGGRELEITRLTLKVSPRIAVKLSSAKPKVVVGPLNRTPELALEVKNEGNVETAYRLTAKSVADVSADALPGEYPDIESRDNWRFLFDKEAEDLRQDGKVPARLRLFRTGIWWLGWWESQKVKAVAVPVTDPRNAGRDGNAVDLVGTRWRLLPLPWFIAIPLLMMFFAVFLGAFGVDDVRVDNAIRAKASDILFVFQDKPDKYTATEDRPPVKMQAKLSWNAPFLSLLKVEASGPGAKIDKTGARTATAERTLTAYTESDQYRVTSILGIGGASSKRVIFLPMRTTDKLSLPLGVSRGGGPERPIPTTGLGTEPAPYTAVLNTTTAEVDGKTMAVVEKTVKIGPNDKLYIYPTNESGGNKVQIYAFEFPKEYTVGALLPDKVSEIPEGNKIRYSLSPKATTSPTDDLWLLTSDSMLSIVHLKIQRTAGGGQ